LAPRDGLLQRRRLLVARLAALDEYSLGRRHLREEAAGQPNVLRARPRPGPRAAAGLVESLRLQRTQPRCRDPGESDLGIGCSEAGHIGVRRALLAGGDEWCLDRRNALGQRAAPV